MNLRAKLLAVLVVVALPAAAFGFGLRPTAESPTERFDAAVKAYRSGDFATASTYWRSLLTEELTTAERAVVLYDLGNAAYRQERLMEAIAWYTSSVRSAPRDRDAWTNLELARLEAELEPADRGDLAATTTRLLESLTPAEASWLVLASLGGWLLVLLVEAVRGGALWRRLALLGLPLVLVSAAPFAWQRTHRSVDPVMVIERPSVPLRAEPSLERSPIGQATAGEVVERIDTLGKWVRVELPDGIRGWVPDSSVFQLR